MTSKQESTANQQKIARVRLHCEQLFSEVLQSGFHGLAKLELTIADGTIQLISRTVHRVEK